MFTGIIQALGRIKFIESRGVDSQLKIDSGKMDLINARVGDSISVSGICLTVIELVDRSFTVDVSGETLSRTTLAQRKAGDLVNLETALTPSAKLGGHFVSGHVDGVGEVIDKREEGRSVRFCFRAPDDLAKYIAEKGSICVDGISLTVNTVIGPDFGVNIVPHTLNETTLGSTRIGDAVNLEVDLLARYLERLIKYERTVENAPGLTIGQLERTGFLDSP